MKFHLIYTGFRQRISGVTSSLYWFYWFYLDYGSEWTESNANHERQISDPKCRCTFFVTLKPEVTLIINLILDNT